MPRKPQFGSIYRRGDVWWIKYYRDGKPFYESSESSKYTDAERLLIMRRAEIVNGTHLESKARRLPVNDLLDGLLRDYKINGKDYDWCEGIVRNHLRPYFGIYRAARFPHGLGEKYIEQRQAQGAPNATINREVALLRRAFNLGRKQGKINVVPVLPSKLTENNVRKGFFERADFIQHREALPPEIRPVTTFAFWTGCRRGEILSLRWTQVDLENRTVRLEPGETKNDEPRIIPLYGELLEILKMQKAIRDQKWPECPWVFFRAGNPIKDFRGAWDKACVAAGMVDQNGDAMRLFHDLRRTGVRNLVRAGVPERVAMAISGHKTRSVFDRYNIVSETDLHDAARKLADYITPAEKSPDGDKTVTIAENAPDLATIPTTSKLLN